MKSDRSSDTSEDEENRRDFQLLNRRLSSSSTLNSSKSHLDSVSTSTSASLSTIKLVPSDYSEVWPLQLNALFVDHYIMGDQIGAGSYAQVRECIDIRDLSRCAVKIVNKDYLRRLAPLYLAGQEQEVLLLRQLSHPNIISMRECLQKQSKMYIFLEYCTFVLSDLLASQPNQRLLPPMARNLFHQLIIGLNYLHSVGIVHRDIKPQNLLLTNRGELKIIDFGVSQAPEVVLGNLSYAGFKVDVWSAGVCLYLMLFGAYPFMDATLLGLYDKILGLDWTIPNFITNSDRIASDRAGHSPAPPNDICNQPNQWPVVIDLLGSMLNKDSNRRAHTDTILSHPWLKLAEPWISQESEFVDLVTQHVQLKQPNQIRDIYRSMSVLPYLHSFHFPELGVFKWSRSGPSSLASRTPSVVSSSNGSQSPASSPSLTKMMAKTAIGTDVRDKSHQVMPDPHEILSDKPIEWGTETQFNLLRLPLIRANRLGKVSKNKSHKGNHSKPSSI